MKVQSQELRNQIRNRSQKTGEILGGDVNQSAFDGGKENGQRNNRLEWQKVRQYVEKDRIW
jgi:hypothetical protein